METIALHPKKIWPLSIRMGHWLLAISFLGAFLTGESDRWHLWHISFGWSMLAIIIFRVYLSVVGTPFTRFSAFAPSMSSLLAYLHSLVKLKPIHYTGHNPAGAIAIFALLGLGALTVMAGIFTEYDVVAEKIKESLGEMHEVLANGLMVLVLLHLAGVAVSSFLHRENLPKAMVTGIKLARADEPEVGIQHSLIDKIQSVLLLALVMGVWFWSFYSA